MEQAQLITLTSSNLVPSINTGSVSADDKIVPFKCEVMYFTLSVNQDITGTSGADHTFNIFVNGSDTGITIGIPSDYLADTPHYSMLSAELFMDAGDIINIVSNNETTTSLSIAIFGCVIRPIDVSRSESDMYLDVARNMDDIESDASASLGVVVPEDAIIDGMWVSTSETIATSGGNGHTLSINHNGVTQSEGFLIPEGTTAGKAVYINLESEFYVGKSDSLRMVSDLEQIAATNVVFMLVMKAA